AHTGPARILDRLGQLDYDAKLDREDYESELGLLQGRLARAARMFSSALGITTHGAWPLSVWLMTTWPLLRMRSYFLYTLR
ncbi:hypothetical protein, partial [Achromobacter xylosoxidans]|uniref:hypothetical protein n=1 Tax=Alcaligenes xylosoxydans xylosoxydans TaxID=85698 RepID=UPI001F0DD9AE